MLTRSTKQTFSAILLFLLLIVPIAPLRGDTPNPAWQPFIDSIWNSTTPAQYINSEKLFDEIIKGGNKLPHNNLKLTWGLNRLANFHHKEGNIKKEESFVTHSLTLQEKNFGKDSPLLASSLQQLASIWQKQLKYNLAQRTLERALKIIEKSYGKNHILTINILKKLAIIDEQTGRTKNALHLKQQIIKQLNQAIPKSSTAMAVIYDKEADIQQLDSPKSREVELQNRALELYMNSRGPFHLARIKLLLSLAESSQKEKKYEEAIEYLKSALAISENIKGISHPDLVDILVKTAKNYQLLNNPPQAQPLLHRSLLILENKHRIEPDHPEIAQIIYTIADNYRNDNKPEQAISLYNRALAILQQNSPSSTLLAKTLNGLAHSLHSKGNVFMAEEANRQAVEMLVVIAGSGSPLATKTLKYHRELIAEMTQKIQPGFKAPTELKEQVRLIQTRLTALQINPGPIDGYIGPRTIKAIKTFNSRMGLLPQTKGKDIPLSDVIAHITPIVKK
ncbi:MAG: tetratricopeptide repeat protein [Magnetococcales bacterium]|nr:tetratricopeptide repeat protein [Magnetococcales bacterium]